MSKHPRMPQYLKEAYMKYCHHVNRGGTPNAIIAGGAIRDTLNGSWVKDIDIFVNAAYAHEFQNMIEEWDHVGKRASKLFDRYGDAILWQPSKKATTSLSVPYGATQGSSSVYMNNMGGTVTFSSPNIASMSTAKQSSDSYSSNNKVVEVYERIDRFGDAVAQLNLIFVEVPAVEYVTKYFDFGICKAWYDGSYVHMHGDFTNDVNNKTITMVLPPEHVIACYGSVKAGLEAMEDHACRIKSKYPGHTIVMPLV